jgi:hypothetical protein
MRNLFSVFLLFATASLAAQAPGAALRGQVSDPSGAFIPGAIITATAGDGSVKTATTDGLGRFEIRELPPGRYTVRALATGFGIREQNLELRAGAPVSVNFSLPIEVDRQEVTVSDSAAQVDVDPASNAGAVVLENGDLEALSDNPEDLAEDLQALAGPGAGPNGGEIYVDGFSGGRIPSKQSIREIRVNQNPFSAEYDRLGFGRIEIFTKPGADKLRGEAFFSFGDARFNSRNPFAADKPPYQRKFFGANLGGPLGKKASFFVDFDRRDVEETAVVNALTLDESLNPVNFSTAILNPTLRTEISPRVDFQLSPNHTLTARYEWEKTSRENEGIGVFSLPSRAYDSRNVEHMVQLTETAVLSARAVNETRFRFFRDNVDELGRNREPTVQVLEAFTSGGAQIGEAYTHEDRYELANTTSVTAGSHFVKFGARLRGEWVSDFSSQNFNGTYTFTSLDAYRTTLLGLEQGLTLPEIRARGGGPSQFTIIGGDPLASVRQLDVGLWAQDDWRLRPNFTLSAGLRYEGQSNINDHFDIAPRVGFAWGIGSRSGGRSPQTVVRGGFGMFYDRFDEELVLQATRLNGVTQQQFVVPFPDFFPQAPDLAALSANRLPQAVREIDSGLRTPYIVQSAIGVERQLPKGLTLAVTYANSRGVHMLRSRNVNAPLPGTGVRPFGDIGNLYLYESSGQFKQNQLITNFRGRLRNVSFFGFYALNDASGNTDGPGTFPSNQYDLSTEWGQTAYNVRHRFLVGGSLSAPGGLRLSPFVMAASGQPFNIVVGRDLNGDAQFTDRPALATDLARASVVRTAWGALDTDPLPGQVLVPRNYGEGPGRFTVNLRLSKTIGLGERVSQRSRGGGPSGPGGGGLMLGRRRGGSGMRGGGEDSGHRYTLTFLVQARNLLNNVNPAPPVGNLSSPLFGQSNALAGGFGGRGGGGGGSASANRRIDFQLRFSF